MTNPLVLYGNATAVYLVLMGSFLLCSSYAEGHPATRMYRTVPQSLAWAMGAGALYSLLQMALPLLDTPGFDTLGIIITYSSGALVAIFFLWRRARYVKDTAALLMLLFALFVILLVNLAGVLPHLAPPSSLLAFYAAWCAIGSVALFPCRWFDRWLGSRLEPILPPPAFLHLPQARRRTPSRSQKFMVEISVAGALSSLAIVAWLAVHHQLASFLAALPWAAGLMLGLYLLGTAIHWGQRWLFLSKPVYGSRSRPLATCVTVTAELCDGQEGGQHLYQGPTTPGGDIPPEVRVHMDELLQSGKAANISYRLNNGLQGSQSLPSYCTGGWPKCKTCSCRQAASGTPLPAQRGEE